MSCHISRVWSSDNNMLRHVELHWQTYSFLVLRPNKGGTASHGENCATQDTCIQADFAEFIHLEPILILLPRILPIDSCYVLASAEALVLTWQFYCIFSSVNAYWPGWCILHKGSLMPHYQRKSTTKCCVEKKTITELLYCRISKKKKKKLRSLLTFIWNAINSIPVKVNANWRNAISLFVQYSKCDPPSWLTEP